MSPTIPQIEQIEKQLETEIAEKQALLKSYRAVRAHLARTYSASTAATAEELGFKDLGPAQADDVKEYGTNTRWVRRAIAAMDRNYTVRDIADWIREHKGNVGTVAIATVLTRLKGTGEIQEFQKGRGRRPTIFKKPNEPST